MKSMKPLLVSDMFLIFNADNISDNRFNIRLTYGLAGSILMDLIVYKKLELNLKRVRIIDTTSTGDQFLDESLTFLSYLKDDRNLNYYLYRIVSKGSYLFLHLIERLKFLKFMNISINEKNAFWTTLPKFSVSYVNDEIRSEISDKLREILLGNSQIPNKSVWFLISLLRATNGYRHIFGKEYRRQVKSRIKELIINEPIGENLKWRIYEAESGD